MSGRLLWVQDYVSRGETTLVQIPTEFNLADIGTKPLPGHRIRMLLYHLGTVAFPDLLPIGEKEAQNVKDKKSAVVRVNKLAKAILQLALISGLEPLARGVEVTAECGVPDLEQLQVPSTIVLRRSELVSLHFLVLAVLLVGSLCLLCILRRKFNLLIKQLTNVTQRVQVLETELHEMADYQHDLSEQLSRVHFGSVELGGFTRPDFVIYLESMQATDRVQTANREEYDGVVSAKDSCFSCAYSQ